MSECRVGGRCMGCAGAAVVAWSAGVAGAETVEHRFEASGAGGRAAAAVFRFDSTARTLTIRIENTSNGAASGGESGALSALFWNMSPPAIPVTGVISSSGGTLNNASGYSPAQMWGYRGNLGSGFTPHGAEYGLSAVGFGVFGHAHLLAPGGPAPRPGDIGGSVVAESDQRYGETHAMYRSYVEFVFGVDRQFFANGTQNIAVSDVTWQFGQSFAQPSLTPSLAPVAPAASIGLAGLAVVAGYRHLRRRALREE